jgi:RNA polymerase sigma factor (sigma-70 family)
MDSAFHHFHKLLGRRQEIDTPDSQLVDRFVSCRDEEAFETLLHRHGGLVWGVCRRMLKDSHLAEDAFQATFLVLAREASSIRKRQSVSSWLYGVAYRLASRVRSDSTRRQQCEGRMRAANEPDPTTDIIRRELRPVLDEELQALPEKYRAPLILCHLQGKTHEQAAQELGWPVGTMSRRLDKGRELLRQRLTLRGVTVSAALLTVTLANESTAAIPAGLVATTLRTAILFASGTTAASALVSASALTLAEGLIKDAAITKLKIAAVSLIGVALATGTGTLVVRAMNGARTQSESRQHAETVVEEPALNQPGSSVEPAEVARPTMTAGGRVLDRTGKPVAGAKVYLSEWSPEEPTFQSVFNFKSEPAQTATDAAGKFQLKDAPVSRPGANLWDLVVVAPGHALAFKPALFADDNRGSTFVLGPEAILAGRLVDPDGKSVAGAGVDLLAVAGLHDSAVPSRWSAGNLHLSPSQIPIKGKTDRDGKFAIRGVPQDVRLTLMVSHDDFERERIFVATTNRKPPDLFDVRGGTILPRRERVYSAQFTHALKAGHRIRGTIVQNDDGLPVPGARVSIVSDWISPDGDAQKYWSDEFSATTDRRGAFIISGFGVGRYTLHVIPPKGSPYLAPYTQADVRPHTSEHEIAVRLVRGGTIHGKVVDSETRSGLSSVKIAYRRRVPGRDQAPASVWEKIQTQTGPGGTFSMRLPVGKCEIYVSEPIPGYATSQSTRAAVRGTGPLVQTVDVRPGQQIDGVLFALNHSAVAGRVFDPDGNPVAGVCVHELSRESERSRTVTDAHGRFVMTGDSPSALRFMHYQRGLGALVREEELRTKNGDLKIHLEALGSVRGAVIDEDRRPLPGALVQLHYTQEGYGTSTVANALVTSDGGFEFASMVPGCQYEIEAWANNYTRFHKELGVAGREQVQLGDVTLRKMDRSIAGRITDDSGAPVADLVLTAACENQDHRVFMRCDAEGRFDVFGVPAGFLRIGALHMAPDDKVVYGPQVESGRKDVHLVFDRASKKFRK